MGTSGRAMTAAALRAPEGATMPHTHEHISTIAMPRAKWGITAGLFAAMALQLFFDPYQNAAATWLFFGAIAGGALGFVATMMTADTQAR